MGKEYCFLECHLLVCTLVKNALSLSDCLFVGSSKDVFGDCCVEEWLVKTAVCTLFADDDGHLFGCLLTSCSVLLNKVQLIVPTK